MKVFALFVAAFAYAALFFVSVHSTVVWWRGDPGSGLIDYALIGTAAGAGLDLAALPLDIPQR